MILIIINLSQESPRLDVHLDTGDLAALGYKVNVLYVAVSKLYHSQSVIFNTVLVPWSELEEGDMETISSLPNIVLSSVLQLWCIQGRAYKCPGYFIKTITIFSCVGSRYAARGVLLPEMAKKSWSSVFSSIFLTFSESPAISFEPDDAILRA